MVAPGAVIIVPWRARGDKLREANLATVLAYLDGLQIAPVMVCGDGRARGPFNRSAAYNRGRAAHPRADVYVFHESDMIVSETQLLAGIEAAWVAPGLVVPFDTYWYLSPEDSHRVRAGADPYIVSPQKIMGSGTAVGAVNICSGESMNAVGGWDERFEGWGFDDRAMEHAFAVTCGQPTRHIRGVGVHLWHEPGWKSGGRFTGGSASITSGEVKATERNRMRYRRYRAARTPTEIRGLTAGG